MSSTEPQIVQREPLFIAGLRYEGNNQHGEIPAMWDELFPRLAELEPIRQGVFYGMARDLPGAASGVFEYLAAVPVRSIENLPPGLVGWDIPGGTYAMLPANDVPDLMRVSHYFYQEWVKGSPYKPSAGYMIEAYPDTYPQDPTIQMLFPVEER